MSVLTRRVDLHCVLICLVITAACDGEIPAETDTLLGELSACTTFEFNLQTGNVPSYVEGDLLAWSLHQDPSRHLHMNGVYLMNHSDCCSTPYQFQLSNLSYFYIQSMNFSYLDGSHTFTSSTGDQRTITYPGNYAMIGTGWDAITWFQWNAAGTAHMESLTLCPSNPAGGVEESNCKPGTPNPAGRIPFTYDRGAASQAAVQLSATAPTSVSQVPVMLHYSGYFMSLALRAGKLPMVLDPSIPMENGWNASWSGSTLLGNSVWNAHSFSNAAAPQSDGALIGYISGAAATGLPTSSQRSFQYTSGANYTTLPVSTLVDVSDGTFHTNALTTLPSDLGTYEPGDYVYLDSREDGEYVTHGLMLVGHGLPISCTNDSLSRVIFQPCRNQSPCPNTIDNSKNTTDDIVNTSVRVPYVVDWNKGLQNQEPRPFYCTASRRAQNAAGAYSWFDHTFWMFIRAPSSGWVDQSIYVAPPVRVARNGGIHRCR